MTASVHAETGWSVWQWTCVCVWTACRVCVDRVSGVTARERSEGRTGCQRASGVRCTRDQSNVFCGNTGAVCLFACRHVCTCVYVCTEGHLIHCIFRSVLSKLPVLVVCALHKLSLRILSYTFGMRTLLSSYLTFSYSTGCCLHHPVGCFMSLQPCAFTGVCMRQPCGLPFFLHSIVLLWYC